MNFEQPLVIATAEMEWLPSPSPMVLRKPLEREAAESGHVTSVVQYLPGASFKQHPHPKGEEILVLEGVFSDETGDYGPGTYIRNPPGSAHTPFSKEGCVILVKLNQFHPDDLKMVRIDTHTAEWLPDAGGLQIMPLHEFKGEKVTLVKWPAGERLQPLSHFSGEEVFILSGKLKDERGSYPARTWLRNPHLSEHQPFAEQETLVWVKSGHLQAASEA